MKQHEQAGVDCGQALTIDALKRIIEQLGEQGPRGTMYLLVSHSIYRRMELCGWRFRDEAMVEILGRKTSIFQPKESAASFSIVVEAKPYISGAVGLLVEHPATVLTDCGNQTFEEFKEAAATKILLLDVESLWGP